MANLQPMTESQEHQPKKTPAASRLDTSPSTPEVETSVHTKPPQDHLSLFLEGELATMERDWKPLIKIAEPCPFWEWGQIKEALLNLTENPVEQMVIRGGLSALIKQAEFKPDELILEELIRLIRASHDLVLQRSVREMLEAEMP